MKLLLSLLFTLFYIVSFSQGEKNKSPSIGNFTKKEIKIQESKDPSQKGFFIVPSFSIGFSSGGFRGALNPNFGYAFAKWIDAGLATHLGYSKQLNEFGYDYHSTTTGIGAFTRIYPLRFAFIQMQPEINYFNVKIMQNGGVDSKYKKNAASFLLGVGYSPMRDHRNTFPFITLLFDILKDKNSPYLNSFGQIKPNLWIGFNIGLFNRKRML